MKLILILFLSLIIGKPTFAQESNSEKPTRKHSISLELLGTSMPYSISYGYLIHPKYEIRAGFGYFPALFDIGCIFSEDIYNCDLFRSSVTTPLVFTYLAGRNRLFLELNIGIRLDFEKNGIYNFEIEQYEDKWMSYLVPIAGLGLRYSGNIMFYTVRVNTSEFLWGKERKLKTVPGFSFGFKF